MANEPMSRNDEPILYSIITIDHKDGRAPYGKMTPNPCGNWMHVNQHRAIVAALVSERQASQDDAKDALRWRFIASRINYTDLMLGEERGAFKHVRVWSHQSNDRVSDSITACVDQAMKENGNG